MYLLARVIIFFWVLALAVNHGVDAGRTSNNPGWGVVWGILFYIIWMIVANLILAFVVGLYRRAVRWSDDNSY